jgi:prevent-host-death family protein
MAAVAVQDLREDLGRYLERVAQGETLEVFDQGRPVAVLSPVPEQETTLARLRREGKVIPARHDLLDFGPPLQVAAPLSASQALAELRAED